MSLAASAIVWRESKQKGSALLMMLALADYAHDDGTNAFPSVGTLASKTRLGRRNVQLLLRKLEQDGELAPMGEHGSGTVVYRLMLPGFAEGAQTLHRPKGQGAQKARQGGEPPFAPPAIGATPDPSFNHQEPSGNLHPVSRLSAAVRMRRR